MPDVSSIDIQSEVQWYMRPYLLDFIIEAHHAFRLLPDTLYLAINLLDRYCSRRVVYKRHYQLVGCAALFIAAKYNDKKENVPTIKELKTMCCKQYDEDMFLQMEWHVLQTLNWQVGHPTVDAFLQIALEEEAPQKDAEVEHMTWYLCELALFHRDFVSVRPSVLARSALALARCILGRPQVAQSEWACRYDSTVILNLANFLSQPSKVLVRKYSYGNVSCVAQTVEYFLQQQQSQQKAAAEAQERQRALEQSHRLSQQIHSVPHLAVDTSAQQMAYLQPQTPQKVTAVDSFVNTHGAAVMQNGCLTPPITPENEHLVSKQYTAWPQPQSGLAVPQQHASQFPPTPTPMSVVQQTFPVASY